MTDPELEQRRRQAAATTLKQRLQWVDDALRLARALQRQRPHPAEGGRRDQ